MLIKHLNIRPYMEIWEQMKSFTMTRNETTEDQCWLLQHFPVYTQGQAGKPEHLLNPAQIPVVQSDRGGQVTYHGPGQLVAYFMIDLKKRHMGIRSLVCRLEKMLISFLSQYDIQAQTHCGAPGVYIGEKKIASLGLRVKNGCTYHGLALNVDMDLNPFLGINPCGFARLQMTQMKDYSANITFPKIEHEIEQIILQQFANE